MIDRKMAGDIEFVKNTIIKMTDGGSSMREIADFLTEKGFPHNRNAIAGKINRLRSNGQLAPSTKTPRILKDTIKPIRLDKKFIPNRTIKIEHLQAKRERYNHVPNETDSKDGVLFLKVKDSQCKWILDFQRKGQKVCCGANVYHRSFCKEHYYICYEPPLKRRVQFNPTMDREMQDVAKMAYKRLMGVLK